MGCSKPFDDLDVDHLEQELVARGIYDFEQTKKERLQLLKETLKGILGGKERAVFGGYCVFWRYTAHYTRLTAKFLGHAQARTSTHERTGTSGPKINGDDVLTVH